MDSNVQPSFIPKKPLSQVGAKPQRGTINLFSIIATVVFVTVVIIAGGIWGFKMYEDSLLAKKQDELRVTLSTFQQSLADDLTRLDARLSSASGLISQHLYIPDFFAALGNATLKNVRFTSFSFSAAPGQMPTVTMSGQAQSYTAILLQGQEFQKPENMKYIKNAVISGPSLNPDGSVTFGLTASINPQLLRYPMVQKTQGLTVSSVVIQATSTDAAGTTTPAKPKTP